MVLTDSSRDAQRSLAAILQELDEVPIESGITHRGELLLAEHIRRFGDNELVAFVCGLAAPGRAAGLLRLSGRCDAVSSRSRFALVTWRLSSPNVELRDAATQSAEDWGDVALAPVLRAHRELVPWLRDYVAAVVRDFEDADEQHAAP